MLKSLYSIEIHQNIAIQNWANNLGVHNFLVFISQLMRAKYLYIYFVPILAIYNHTIFRRILLLMVVSEYVTLVLKWLLPEIRPNWMSLTPPLKLLHEGKYCESTSGFPSGHLVLATSIMFAFVKYSVSKRKTEKRPTDEVTSARLAQIISCTFSAVFLTLLILSRMDLGVHFLHQCLAGVLVGYAIAYFLFQNSVNQYYKGLSREMAISFVAGMVLLVVVIYYAKIALKLDPLWDTKTSSSKCQVPKHLDGSSAIYGYCYIIGILLGLAVSSPLKECGKGMNATMGAPAVLIVMVLQRVAIAYIPRTHGELLFYGLILFSYFCYTFALVWLIPKILYSQLDSEKAAAADNLANVLDKDDELVGSPDH